MKTPTPGTALLLVNPSSGNGRALKHWEAAAAALRAAGYTPQIHITENLSEATTRARSADAGSLVAALGGDGFLGASAAGAKDSGAILLPLAGGRGNDTVRRLGLNVDPVKTIEALDALVVQKMDMGLVNGHPYLGVANAGFDALSNEFGNNTRLKLGPFIYLYGGLKAFAQWRNVIFTVGVNGEERTFPGWFVAAANVGQYGAGVRISPDAKVDDGLLDVVSLGKASIIGVAATFLRAYRGSHIKQSNITFAHATEVTISANKALNIYADGENVGALPAKITIEPASLNVLVPSHSPAFN